MPRIRPAHIDDLPAISAVCLAAFTAAVAPSLSAAGIATFGSVAAADAFAARLQGDNHILVAEQDDRIVGVVELKEGRHLAMLFVDPGCQGQGPCPVRSRAAAPAHPGADRARLAQRSAYLPALWLRAGR